MTISHNPTGEEGQLYDLSRNEFKGRTIMKSHIAFGRVVIQDGDNQNGVRLPDRSNVLNQGATSGETDKVIGILVHEASFPCECHELNLQDLDTTGVLATAVTKNKYLRKTEVGSIATMGRIYMRAEQDVNPTDPVYFRVIVDNTSPYKKNLGTVRKDDDGGKAVRLQGAKFTDIAAAAGEMAVVDLNYR